MVNHDLWRVAAKGILKALGEELRDRREAKGLSQEALADRAGLHRNFIGLMERGQRNSTLITLDAVAGALKVRVSDLVVGAERRQR